MKHIDLKAKLVKILRNQPGKTLWFINRYYEGKNDIKMFRVSTN